MNTIKHPMSTEKSIKLMESENKLIFAVDKKATKDSIKAELQSLFNCKIKHVTTRIGPDGHKRAYVRFNKETPAIDVATKLGMI